MRPDRPDDGHLRGHGPVRPGDLHDDRNLRPHPAPELPQPRPDIPPSPTPPTASFLYPKSARPASGVPSARCGPKAAMTTAPDAVSPSANRAPAWGPAT